MASAIKHHFVGVRADDQCIPRLRRVVDALGEARQAVKEETGLVREHSKLPAWMRDEISTGLQDGMPKGYEEMIAEYFRALAEKPAVK